MTPFAPPATGLADAPPVRIRAAAAAPDLLSLTALLVLFLALSLPCDRLPMLMVDESRNALNALSIDLHGHWLVPAYNGAPDHWNTKPPLLIWMIAGLLRLGAPALLALRLPSLVAAAATVLLTWWFCRRVLHDRRAALLAGVLLLTSSLYMGPHVARSGDYDSLVTAFLLGQALSLWIAIETRPAIRTVPFAIFAACIVGAVLTKGIEGTLLLPVFLLFALLRRRLPALLRDPWAWVLTLAATGLCLGYYLTRPLYDPGYLAAVWHNELGGRFAGVQDRSAGDPLYYARDLVRRFEPGLLLLPLAGLALASRDARRRSAVWFCLLCGAELFLVITKAATKHYWYAAPMIPLLSIAAGIGTADALVWLSQRQLPRFTPPRFTPPRFAEAALIGLLVGASMICVVRNQVWSVRGLRAPQNDQFWYGGFLRRLRREHAVLRLAVFDNGLPNRTGFADYNPMLQFYAAWETQRGMAVALYQSGVFLPPGTAVATCDLQALSWLQTHADLSILQRNHACAFGRIARPQRGAGTG